MDIKMELEYKFTLMEVFLWEVSNKEKNLTMVEFNTKMEYYFQEIFFLEKKTEQESKLLQKEKSMINIGDWEYWKLKSEIIRKNK